MNCPSVVRANLQNSVIRPPSKSYRAVRDKVSYKTLTPGIERVETYPASPLVGSPMGCYRRPPVNYHLCISDHWLELFHQFKNLRESIATWHGRHDPHSLVENHCAYEDTTGDTHMSPSQIKRSNRVSLPRMNWKNSSNQRSVGACPHRARIITRKRRQRLKLGKLN